MIPACPIALCAISFSRWAIPEILFLDIVVVMCVFMFVVVSVNSMLTCIVCYWSCAGFEQVKKHRDDPVRLKGAIRLQSINQSINQSIKQTNKQTNKQSIQ